MAGRGKKREFTKAQIAKIKRLALLNCNTNTIAEAIDVPVDTLKSRPDIQRILLKNRAQHRIAVHEAQNGKALEAKDTTMLIWLGKNDLGQTDRQETSHKVSEGTAKLLGLIDGSCKGRLPDSGEVEEAGQ